MPSQTQIYFDNTNISDITSSSDVQGAIEDISELNAEVIRDNFSYLNCLFFAINSLLWLFTMYLTFSRCIFLMTWMEHLLRK
jgi:hypothetical protein